MYVANIYISIYALHNYDRLENLVSKTFFVSLKISMFII